MSTLCTTDAIIHKPIPDITPHINRLWFVLSLWNKYCLIPSSKVGRTNKIPIIRYSILFPITYLVPVTIHDIKLHKRIVLISAVHLQQSTKQYPNTCGARSALRLHKGFFPIIWYHLSFPLLFSIFHQHTANAAEQYYYNKFHISLTSTTTLVR